MYGIDSPSVSEVGMDNGTIVFTSKYKLFYMLSRYSLSTGYEHLDCFRVVIGVVDMVQL